MECEKSEDKKMPMKSKRMSQQQTDICEEMPKQMKDNPMARSGGTLVPLGKKK